MSDRQHTDMVRNTHIDNRHLVEQCIGADKEALALFYERFAPRMLALVMRIVRNRDDAEDILHDGFIIAMTRLKSLRDPERVDYWLASIMKNLSLQFLKNQDVVSMLDEISDVEDTADIDGIIDLEVLESLIRKLPPGYQKVFRLSVLEGKSHKEIAEILGIAPNSSSSQLFHAKMMMRKLITDYRLQAGIFMLAAIAATTGVWILTHRESEHNHTSAVQIAEKSKTTKNKAMVTAPESDVASKDDETSSEKKNPTSTIRKEATPGTAQKPVSLTFAQSMTDTVAPAQNTEKLTEPDIAERNVLSSDTVDPECPDIFNIPLIDPTGHDNNYAYEETSATHGEGNGWSLTAGGNLPTGNSNVTGLNPDGIWNPGGDQNNPIEPLTFDDYKDINHTNHTPVSFSLTARKAITPRLGIETGAVYTMLRSSFAEQDVKTRCTWHYLGVPLRVSMRTFETGRLSTYAAAGARIDIPLLSESTPVSNADPTIIQTGRFKSPAVFSLEASYGFSVKLSNSIELFIEPSVSYHFNRNYTVPNTWTDNRWTFSLPAGLRFNW